MKEIGKQLANLLAAIKEGIITTTTKSELQRLEAERDELKARERGESKRVHT